MLASDTDTVRRACELMIVLADEAYNGLAGAAGVVPPEIANVLQMVRNIGSVPDQVIGIFTSRLARTDAVAAVDTQPSGVVVSRPLQARRLRVAFASKDVDVIQNVDRDEEKATTTIGLREFDALCDQARISAVLADGPEDTGAVLLVRVENLRVVERRLIELEAGDALVRMNDVAQLMREIVL